MCLGARIRPRNGLKAVCECSDNVNFCKHQAANLLKLAQLCESNSGIVDKSKDSSVGNHTPRAISVAKSDRGPRAIVDLDQYEDSPLAMSPISNLPASRPARVSRLSSLMAPFSSACGDSYTCASPFTPSLKASSTSGNLLAAAVLDTIGPC